MRQKVFVALPVYGGLDPLFSQCLARLIKDPPVAMALRMQPGDSLVSRSRNTLTADFLESDCTDLVFIDTDLVFSNEQLERLCGHDAEVVGGFYPKKQPGPVAWVCNGCLTPTTPGADGLQEVRYMGTGFLRVRRGVFERMMAAYPELQYTRDERGRVEWDFWSVGVYEYADGLRRYLSEDWFFCQRWLDLGGKVYGDTRLILRHVGQAVYPLPDQEEQIRKEAKDFFAAALVTQPPESAAAGAGPVNAPRPAPLFADDADVARA